MESESRYSLFSESGSESAVHSPFNDNLERVTQLLNDLRMKLPATELKDFDSIIIKGQLDDCVVRVFVSLTAYDWFYGVQLKQ